MKRNLIYLILAFLLGCVGFSSASQTNAYDLSSFGTNLDYNFNGYSFNKASNNFTICDPATQACGGQSSQTYKYTCYTWNTRYHFYYANYVVGGTTSCESPYTIGQGYSTAALTSAFFLYTSYKNGNAVQNVAIPNVSAQSNNGGIDFAYIRGSEGKIIYNVPSNTAFTYEYNGNTYTLTKAFFYPNRMYFSTSDGSFFIEVGAGGNVVDGFFVMDPSLSVDNIFYVVPSMLKAWSFTLEQSEIWNLLLGNTSYSSLVGDNGISDLFENSYTLTPTVGGTIFPTTFYTYPQDGDIGFSYSQDSSFVPPPSDNDSGDNSELTGGTISYSKDYLSCVQYYTQLDNLNTFYSRCGSDWRNGLLTGSSSDQLANMTALSNYFENPSSGYNGTSFNNYNCDGTITVISGLNNLYGSNWSTVLDDYSMIGVSGNFDASNFCQGAINDNSWVSMHNMLDYLAINGTGSVDCDTLDNLFDRLECQLGIGQYTSTQFDTLFDKFVGLIGIVVDKFFNLIEDGFNTGYHISGDSSWLSCSNSSVEIPYIDYVQYIALFFIILFFIKLI